VDLLDGSYHEVDSSELPFKLAASIAVKEAVRKANPILLEPVMKVDVNAPPDYLGAVVGDISSRRGRVAQIDERNEIKYILAISLWRRCSDIRHGCGPLPREGLLYHGVLPLRACPGPHNGEREKE